MKKKSMRKNLLRTIKNSMGRYAAIVAIIALGSAMFVGLITTKSDMIATGQEFMDKHHMFDLRLLSSYGWTQTEVDGLREFPGVEDAEGTVVLDAIASRNGEKSAVYKFHALPERISTVNILGGRMPQGPYECLIDGFGMTDEILGAAITISAENETTTLDSFTCHTFTVVGYVSSPLYMDMSRGGTNLGNGNVAGYVYLHPDAFGVEYFTEIGITMDGDHAIYSEEFNQALEAMTEKIDPEAILLANNRFASLKADAEESYQKGWQEYQDGLAELADVREELANAYRELLDAEAELKKNTQKLMDGQKEWEEGVVKLEEEKANLQSALQDLEKAKLDAQIQFTNAYNDLVEKQNQVQDALAQIDANLLILEDGIAQLASGVEQIEAGIVQLEGAIATLQPQIAQLQSNLDALIAMPSADPTTIQDLQMKLAMAQGQMDVCKKQHNDLLLQHQEYSSQLDTLQSQKKELFANRVTLVEAETAIIDGFAELERSKADANAQLAEAEAQIIDGQRQLEDAQAELDQAKIDLDDGFAALEEGKIELDDGWAEFEKAKLEAEPELQEAEEKLADAALELQDARKEIDSMDDPEVFILDRNSNAGYLALDNNSEIVQGVSKVFPAFFLLIAALVCITTMTRMVEEERTQIGTLKALGYSNAAIIGKYIAYAASAGILGCGFGVLVGSAIFPTILWSAYGLVLNITPQIRLLINWPLCIAVVSAYTAVVLLVTWYCCRRSLREAPAELIRPKAPTAGKKIFLERLFFWKHINFLNKVMLRNVFRYRQRMLMMLIGIGGCTALLLTGFGLKDSIVILVSDQFENVATQDMDIYFSEAQTPQQQEQFTSALESDTSKIFFFYQSSVEVFNENQSRDIYMLAADAGIRDFMYLRQDGRDLGMPGVGEAFLSVGVADMLSAEIGDTVTLRDADMRELTVTVSGIYHNAVNNYAIVLPQTLEDQWGEAPGCQMAFLYVAPGRDVHEVGAKIMDSEGVLNVTISQDVAEQVTSMLEALNLVVVTIVICAAALAMIVLYNLTNINITERIREIATIKVLGFRAGETAAYVFKENLLLSAMGVLLGMVGGWYLLLFVMSEIRVDFVWFDPQLKPISVILSVVLTMLAACLVDFFLYFKLEKINMAEALKSVE